MADKNVSMEALDRAILLGNVSWWEMKLPSGDVIFGDAKAKMLGYPETMFRHYKDFMRLVHPEDAEKAMQAMRDHMNGKADVYETTYRIKQNIGEYIRFYDCGQITKREGNTMTVMGFVLKIKEDGIVSEEIKNFKKMIIEGKPSIIELVAKIRA